MIQRLITQFCGGLSALALFAIMMLTLLDVIGRKFFNHSLPGALELTEFLMVVVIFGALPLVTLKAEHVVFDSFDKFLTPAMQKMQRYLVHIVCALLLLGLAYLMWKAAVRLDGTGETSAQLQLNKANFVFGMSFACLLTSVTELLMLSSVTNTEETAGVL
ncbi:MAG: hypothetical protein RLZZ502_295 [Pseudomonadota bacterium]|jgi:TRAP-type C4-dicarboxylate transport system permease small subunit